jgi:hypothetical protein
LTVDSKRLSAWLKVACSINSYFTRALIARLL